MPDATPSSPNPAPAPAPSAHASLFDRLRENLRADLAAVVQHAAAIEHAVAPEVLALLHAAHANLESVLTELEKALAGVVLSVAQAEEKKVMAAILKELPIIAAIVEKAIEDAAARLIAAAPAPAPAPAASEPGATT